MRILMVTSELSADGRSGGAGIYAYHLSRELTRQGHYVDLLATVDPGWNAQTPFAVYGLNLSRLPIIGMLKWSIVASVCSMKLMRKRRYDVVNVHHPLSMVYPLIWRPRIPMIASMHTGWALTNPRKSRLRRVADFLIDLAVCKRCERIIVLNRHSESRLLRWGFSREMIQYIPNGVDCSEFLGERKGNSKTLRQKLGVPASAAVVLCVSRLEKGKGVENLLEALQIVQRRASRPVWAIVVGDGALRRSLVRRSHDIRSVVFTGSICRDDLISAYRESDLFVMPSEGGEGMATVLLEAMAAGLPIVAARVPGNVEAIDAEFGRLVAPNDPDQLALTMLSMIGDPASLRQMGSRASLFSRRFGWNVIATRVAGVFKSCLKK